MEGCAHHWRLEAPNGPMSLGQCRHCGDERSFPNAAPDLDGPIWQLNGLSMIDQADADLTMRLDLAHGTVGWGR